jgi:hypothetical protein
MAHAFLCLPHFATSPLSPPFTEFHTVLALSPPRPFPPHAHFLFLTRIVLQGPVSIQVTQTHSHDHSSSWHGATGIFQVWRSQANAGVGSVMIRHGESLGTGRHSRPDHLYLAIKNHFTPNSQNLIRSSGS